MLQKGEITMKKICYVTTVPGTLRSFVLPTAKYLHEQAGFDISFVCDDNEEFAKLLPEYVHYFPVSMKRGISLGGLKAMNEMRKLFKKEKFDLVQYSTPNASCYASLASWMAKTPVRLYCQWGLAYVGFSGVKRKIFKGIEKMVCTLSTWIEPDSFGNLEFSHKERLYSQNKGSVIWNGSASGVNLNKFDVKKKKEWREAIRKQYSIPMDATVFLFVGRITRDKGIDELLAATKKLMEQSDRAYLLMVGSKENVASLQQDLYEWSQYASRVIYCGYTNVVEQYVASSDVYVLPSYREGFGSAVIEAEAMGVPVIVSDIPGPTDAMKRDITGLIVEKGDSESLYSAMWKLHTDKELRERLGENAYKFATENFEQQELCRKILEDRKRLLNLK